MPPKKTDYQMKPEEFTAAIAKLELSQVKAGKFLGVSPRTSRRFVSGEKDIPRSAAAILKVMIKHKLTVDDVNKLLEA